MIKFLFTLSFFFQKDGTEFEFPDIFGKGLPTDKEFETMRQGQDEVKKGQKKDWDKLNIPPWFR